MRTPLFPVLAFLAGLALPSCTEQPETTVGDSLYVLSPAETALCKDQGIDTSAIKILRGNCRADFEKFLPDTMWTLDMDGILTGEVPDLVGISFTAQSVLANDLCVRYQEDMQNLGLYIFVADQNFGIDNDPDKVAIVHAQDQFEVLRRRQTDGINYDIDNDSVISIIRTFDAKYELTLTGAGLDWCQFTIGKEPSDWDAMAEEVYEVCPDVVDQGTGTVEDLASELKENKTLYLWWD